MQNQFDVRLSEAKTNTAISTISTTVEIPNRMAAADSLINSPWRTFFFL